MPTSTTIATDTHETTQTPTTETTTAQSSGDSDLITTAGTTDPSTTDETTTGETGAAPVGHANFVLAGEDYDNQAYAWSNDGGNLVYCYYYAGEAKGDYLWIRFAESPEQNGDTSPHIDIDVCRFANDGFGGTFDPQDPTNFGSQCPADPGFGIWWHAGDIAYNNDPKAENCLLEASVEGEVVTGTFHCSPLPELDGTKTLAVSEGSFSCKAEAK